MARKASRNRSLALGHAAVALAAHAESGGDHAAAILGPPR
jgi:hypothetical protein